MSCLRAGRCHMDAGEEVTLGDRRVQKRVVEKKGRLLDSTFKRNDLLIRGSMGRCQRMLERGHIGRQESAEACCAKEGTSTGFDL
ncbi:hypothetical protein CEXT_805901 [Caerostris extrusa]|uniref:Uncharacterized protein n=1 Tax=Caerostris extrusa TaxID=172846 RepID=A0AAV4PC77_CAEEX|nr:hypothetical protein CEXT_805901 [Caerostris extrusa]